MITKNQVRVGLRVESPELRWKGVIKAIDNPYFYITWDHQQYPPSTYTVDDPSTLEDLNPINPETTYIVSRAQLKVGMRVESSFLNRKGTVTSVDDIDFKIIWDPAPFTYYFNELHYHLGLSLESKSSIDSVSLTNNLVT